jgi:hypothetical protein
MSWRIQVEETPPEAEKERWWVKAWSADPHGLVGLLV